MHTRITIFVILALIILGFEIQSGRVRIVGDTYITDSTSTLTAFNKSIVVNGDIKPNAHDIVIPNTYALRVGDQSNYPGQYIAGQDGSIFYDSRNHAFYTDHGSNLLTLDSASGMVHYTRHSEGKGSSSVTAASKITLGLDGNTFTVTGNTNIDTIAVDGWASGSHVTLYFTGTPTINNQSTGTGRIYCQGSNISVTAGDVYEFFLDGTIWRRIK